MSNRLKDVFERHSNAINYMSFDQFEAAVRDILNSKEIIEEINEQGNSTR